MKPYTLCIYQVAFYLAVSSKLMQPQRVEGFERRQTKSLPVRASSGEFGCYGTRLKDLAGSWV